VEQQTDIEQVRARFVTIINRTFLDSRELVRPRNLGGLEHTLTSSVDGVVPVVIYGVLFSISVAWKTDQEE
jgi:hypothetical protein